MNENLDTMINPTKNEQGVSQEPPFAHCIGLISAFDKNFSSARAIHENIVKVPYWSIKDGCDRAPGWLTHYVQGCCAAATIVNGKVIFLTGNASSSLNWHIDEGISIRSPKKHLKMDDDDEPCD